MMVGTDYVAERGTTFLVDLAPPEEAILGGMRSRTRTYVRQGSRNGLRAEVATEVGFADEYYRLLSGVFARQGLAPTYGIERVRRLIETLQPTGQLLLLQVPAPEAGILAAGIFVGRGQTAVLWGAASARSL